MINLSFNEVLALSRTSNVIPIVETLFSSGITPLGAFENMSQMQPGTFLLESAEHGVWSRYSFVGLEARGFLKQEFGDSSTWVSEHGYTALPKNLPQKLSSGALDALELVQSAWNSPSIVDLPPLTSGLVGALAWDSVREVENLPNRKPLAYKVPVMNFILMRNLLVFDHQLSRIQVVSNLFVEGQSEQELKADYEKALTELELLTIELASPSASYLAELSPVATHESRQNQTQDFFEQRVRQAQEHVNAGDVFQVVLSQRFDLQTESSPLDVYRALRSINPSPYMYQINLSDSSGGYAIVGSSPEALVKVFDSRAIMHPIAGSKPRGKTFEEDIVFAESLLSDEKELAEHLMLVDLARNDLLKVCDPKTVTVTEFMKIHKFSHIQHLVSTVEGSLDGKSSVVDVFRATFPAGTLSGAPKPRALEIIDDLESDNRGLFGGVVGYFDFAGNADLAIAIRTALMRDGVAHIQAGAGIVLDSDPTSEYNETRNKAAVILHAIDVAASLRRID
jgi:anthranilate synthase component 1